jgi:hypothetical protein
MGGHAPMETGWALTGNAAGTPPSVTDVTPHPRNNTSGDCGYITVISPVREDGLTGTENSVPAPPPGGTGMETKHP